MADLTERRPRVQDIAALVGMLAVIDGEMRVSGPDDVPGWASRIRDRLARDGLVASDATLEDVWRAVGDLNQRMRYVMGEHDDPARVSD